MSKQSCFIIMPLTTPDRYVDTYGGDDQHFIHVLDHLFKPAIEAAGMEPIPPISKGSEVIHGDIIRNLETADLVLCDMSILNPNVFFELGIRTALNKNVAMIRDNVTERVPFDTTIINYHEYDCSLSAWTIDQQIDYLKAHIEDCMENGEVNSLWGYFSMSQQAEVPNDAPNVERQLGYLIKQVESLKGNVGKAKRYPISLNPATFSEEDLASEIHEGIAKIILENSPHQVTQTEIYDDGANRVYTTGRLSENTRHLVTDYLALHDRGEVSFFTGDGFYAKHNI